MKAQSERKINIIRIFSQFQNIIRAFNLKLETEYCDRLAKGCNIRLKIYSYNCHFEIKMKLNIIYK